MQLHSILATLITGILISTTAFAATEKNYEEAIFAGGCFWCMEGPYDKLDGVISTTSGYTDGQLKNPTYRQVSSGNTGHTEAVRIVYDPSKISYEKLLEVFWVNIDPLTANAQFCDHGTQYRSGIYYLNDTQKSAAMASLKRVQERLKKPVVTEIDKASEFYPAEEYHQDYYKKNPVRYKYYRWRCGRDQRLQEIWGDDAPAVEK
jgi:peptide-methionine (S)-S-oxide reductase